MRKLTKEEIKKISEKSDVDRKVVENFLTRMGTDVLDAIGELCEEGKRDGWNEKTIMAVLEGIGMALW